jgi:hypothetical protein
LLHNRRQFEAECSVTLETERAAIFLEISNISEMKKILDLVVLLSYLRNKYGAGAVAITLADIQSATK